MRYRFESSKDLYASLERLPANCYAAIGTKMSLLQHFFFFFSILRGLPFFLPNFSDEIQMAGSNNEKRLKFVQTL